MKIISFLIYIFFVLVLFLMELAMIGLLFWGLYQGVGDFIIKQNRAYNIESQS